MLFSFKLDDICIWRYQDVETWVTKKDLKIDGVLLSFKCWKFILQVPMEVQWLSMVRDKIPMIWDIIDHANYSLDLHADLTKFDHHKNSKAGDTKSSVH